MYRDNTLIPSEAIRLLALGILGNGPRHYAALASEVRHFTSHIVGPSLDLVGAPLELLKIEGLIETLEGEGMGDNALLRITEAGRDALMTLLASNVRAPVTDINKLIIALKMRFLHLLPHKERRLQVEVLVEMCERELARLIGLRADLSQEPGHLNAWLDHDIAAIRARVEWFKALRDNLTPVGAV